MTAPKKTTQPGFVGEGSLYQAPGWHRVSHRDAAFESWPRPRDRAPVGPFIEGLTKPPAGPPAPSWPGQAPVHRAWTALRHLLKAGPSRPPLPGPPVVPRPCTSPGACGFWGCCSLVSGLRWAGRGRAGGHAQTGSQAELTVQHNEGKSSICKLSVNMN